MNDPAFEPQFNLPKLDIDDGGNVVLGSKSQDRNTQRTSSQLSPFAKDLSLTSLLSAAELLLPQSSATASFHQLEMPFEHDSLAFRKAGEDGQRLGLEEEPLNVDDDWDIRIDADGNIIHDEEPGLPALSRPAADEPHLAMPQNEIGPGLEHHDDIVLEMGDDPLPDAEAFSRTQAQSEEPQVHDSSSVTAAASVRKRRRALIRPDQATMITRAEQQTWNNNYVERMTEARNKPRKPAAIQASKTAYQYLFGNGIFGVAVTNGITGPNHPLAELFSGAALRRGTGFVIDGNEGLEVGRIHGQRRSSTQAFPESEEAEGARRVRPHLDDDQGQRGHSAQPLLQEDNTLTFFEPDVEVGREPGSEMANLTAPWNRSGSVPGSSVKGGSARAAGAGPSRVSASPLHGRGADFPAIERFSDDIPYGSDDFMAPNSSSAIGAFRPAGQEGASTTSQMLQNALNHEGRNFLEFVEGVAAEKGEKRRDRRWVAFDDLFEQHDRNTVVATQAFFHILTLATKDVIKVQQQDSLEVEFGMIYIGVKVGEQAAKNPDVLMGGVGVEVEGMSVVQGEVHGAARDSEEGSSFETMA